MLIIDVDGGCQGVRACRVRIEKVVLPNQNITIFKTNWCSEILDCISSAPENPVLMIREFWFGKMWLLKAKIFWCHFDDKYRFELPKLALTGLFSALKDVVSYQLRCILAKTMEYSFGKFAFTKIAFFPYYFIYFIFCLDFFVFFERASKRRTGPILTL